MKVIKGGMQLLVDCTPSEKKRIKEDLTLDNPAYTQVKKFSPYQYTAVSPYLTYYTDSPSGMLVPRGYTPPFEYEVIADDRIEVATEYPQFKLKLRGTQIDSYKEWESNADKGVIVLPTGKGKSILGTYMAYKKRQRTLIIVQKDDLVTGWRSDMRLSLGLRPKQVGLIKAGTFRIGKQITLATIQTLSRLDTAQLRELYNTFGMVIVDEFHHSASRIYEIVKYFQAKYLVGLTATDDRGDGLKKVLNFYFGEVAYRYLEQEGDEDIMPYTVLIKNTNITYDPPERFLYKRGEISAEQARELMEIGEYVKRIPLDPTEMKNLLKDEEFNQMVARDIKAEYERGKACIAFLHEKGHIRYLRDLLIALGVNEGQIQLYYGDATEKNEVMKKRAETKEVLITLATFAKATEGTNVKSWERGFLVTSINDEKNTIQAVGRLRRRKEGKEDVIIYDYRHPKAKGLVYHGATRDKAYKKNKAKIVKDTSRPLFSKGWNRTM